MTRRAWQELRGPVSALVLLGLIARLLLPLPALALPPAPSALSGFYAGALCLAAGGPEGHEPVRAPASDHCALCRLPEAAAMPPPDMPAPRPSRWSVLAEPPLPAAEAPARPPARGPPPSRGPPIPTFG